MEVQSREEVARPQAETGGDDTRILVGVDDRDIRRVASRIPAVRKDVDENEHPLRLSEPA